MNQKISAGMMIIIAVVIIITAGMFFWIGKKQSQSSVQQVVENESDNSDIGDKERACVASGGTVQKSMCCGAVGDFPKLCGLWGACACGPNGSHEIKVCNCGENRCFDGDKCKDNSAGKISCAKEGDVPTALDMATGKQKPGGISCCGGLQAINKKTAVESLSRGICESSAGNAGVCSPCGDGVCGAKLEDKCNCPKDCK